MSAVSSEFKLLYLVAEILCSETDQIENSIGFRSGEIFLGDGTTAGRHSTCAQEPNLAESTMACLRGKKWAMASKLSLGPISSIFHF